MLAAQALTSACVHAECCLGTMTWGVQNTEGDAHKQLSYALQDMGLNFMDTAEIYPVPPRFAYSSAQCFICGV